MTTVRKTRALGTAVLGLFALALAGCASPMPPDVAAIKSEQVVICQDGDVKVSVPAQLSDVVNTWVTDYTSNCSQSTVTVVDDKTTDADVYLALGAQPSKCSPEVTSPVAFDAGVIVASFSDGSTINLSPKTAAALISGKITHWNDPAIVNDNSGVELPNEPVVINPYAFGPALDAVTNWLSSLGAAPATSLFKADDSWASDSNLAQAQGEGVLSIEPYAYATNNSLGIATLQVTQGQDAVSPSSDSIYSGTTKVELSASGSSLGPATINYTASPQSQDGSDQASAPWDAVYPVTMSVCSGDHALQGRAFTRFALRADEQTQVADSSFSSVPDTIRFTAIGAVVVGLPTPTAIPSASDSPASSSPAPSMSEAATPVPSDSPTQ